MRIYIASDTLVELSNLRDETTDTVITDATVTGRLFNPDDDSDISTFAMSHTQDGRYVGAVSHQDVHTLASNQALVLDVTAEKDGAKILKRMTCRAVYASAND